MNSGISIIVRIERAKNRRETVAKFSKLNARPYTIAEILGVRRELIQGDINWLKSNGTLKRSAINESRATKRSYYNQIKGKMLRLNLFMRIYTKYYIKRGKKLSVNKTSKRTGISVTTGLKYINNLKERGYLNKFWNPTRKGRRRFYRGRSFIDGVNNLRNLIIHLINKKVGV